jgi:hypothetical protein
VQRNLKEQNLLCYSEIFIWTRDAWQISVIALCFANERTPYSTAFPFFNFWTDSLNFGSSTTGSRRSQPSVYYREYIVNKDRATEALEFGSSFLGIGPIEIQTLRELMSLEDISRGEVRKGIPLNRYLKRRMSSAARRQCPPSETHYLYRTTFYLVLYMFHTLYYTIYQRLT